MHTNAEDSFGTTIEIDTLRQVLNYFFSWFPTAQLRDVGLVQATECKSTQTSPTYMLTNDATDGQHLLSEFVGPEWEELF